MPPTARPIPALIAVLIATAFADVSKAPPNAAKNPKPVPQVAAVTIAPAITTPAPIANFAKLSLNQSPTPFQNYSQE